jgi:hypothetical protein
MPHHEWGDKDFDWDSLYQAINTGTMLMKRFGRIGVHSKEKYGTARWSLYLFNGSMHSLTHPGYVSSRYPKWLWEFDCKKPLKFLKPLIIPWQELVIKQTFNYLAKKYPHIVDEIISDAPRELLSFTLKKRAGKLWKTSCKKCNNWYTCDNDGCPYCEELEK